MVLAAGLGTRMRPLTLATPKPLVRVAGRALLDWALDRCAEAALARVVVNVHHLAGQVEAHVAGRAGPPPVLISDERAALLETGGGVVKALPLLAAETVYVINSDNLWLDARIRLLDALAMQWNPAIMDALLMMVPLARASGYAGFGDFSMDPLGRLSRRREGRLAAFVFGGVQILSTRLLEGAPAGAFSLNWAFDRALAQGRLYGMAHTGQWFHVGDAEGLREAEAVIAAG